MASATTLIPVAEYLKTSYRPDCDYVEGELRERNLGERPHALLQGIFYRVFDEHWRDWGVIALTEQRLQISAERYRIADVCVVRRSDPADAVVRVAPVVCIEILSKGDSLGELQERVDDYLSMGAENVWVIDAWKRRGYVGSMRGFNQPEAGKFVGTGSAIEISLDEVFAAFDERQATKG